LGQAIDFTLKKNVLKSSAEQLVTFAVLYFLVAFRAAQSIPDRSISQ
jgi:hypothetical protein